ncbi:MAG: MoaD/ThiS family protein [Candidatus Thorarchaeota archaeon]|nr:MAG: MoaD/ThiS family protein [Candidatus Thorarchaeota archaeon]
MSPHWVDALSETLGDRIKRIIVTETKTVRELLAELDLSNDHVVLLDGKRIDLDTEIHENDSVVVLPLIEGG